MRRFLPILLAAALLLCCRVPTALAAPPNGTVTVAVYDYDMDRYGDFQAVPRVSLRLNGAPIEGEMPAVVLGSRTMAPLRLLAERLKAEVEWVPDAARVVVRQGSDTVVLDLGSPTAYVNGAARPMPDGVPAAVVYYEGQGYTMVPLRFFSETFRCQVEWEQSSYTASVTAPDPLPAEPEPPEEPPAKEPEPIVLDTPKSPEKYLIALDAGHGGPWSGAYYEKTAEKDLNIAITKKVNALLLGLGYRTLMTRKEDEDVGLTERTDIANAAGADIFVSVHCNAADNVPSFQGLYVYHFPGSVQGAKLAQSIQTPACRFTGAVDREINSANFAVLRESKMPAVLIETGFMSCHEELTRLKDDGYQTRLAQGIAQGIIRYLNSRS